MNEVLGYDAASNSRITEPQDLVRITGYEDREDFWQEVVDGILPSDEPPQVIGLSNGQHKVSAQVHENDQLIQALSRQVANTQMALHHRDGMVAQLLLVLLQFGRLLQYQIGYCDVVNSTTKIFVVSTPMGQMFFPVEQNWFTAITQGLNLHYMGVVLQEQTFDNLTIIESLQHVNTPDRETGIPVQQLVPILQLLVASQAPCVEISLADDLPTIQLKAVRQTSELVFQATCRLESAIYPTRQ